MQNLQLSGKTVQCKVCGKDTALEEEYNEITSWLCINCGYMSNTTLVENSPELLQSPQTIQDEKVWDDERKIYWILSVINMPKRGLLFPELVGGNIIWTLVPIVEISDEERKNYPIGDNSGKFHTHKMEPSLSKKYPRFYDAIKELGAIVDINKLEE